MEKLAFFIFTVTTVCGKKAVLTSEYLSVLGCREGGNNSGEI